MTGSTALTQSAALDLSRAAVGECRPIHGVPDLPCEQRLRVL